MGSAPGGPLMAQKRGMGRGLSAILPDAETAGDGLRQLPVELVRPNPNQPRTRFDEDSLDSLAISIGASGIVQPLLVRSVGGGNYEIIAGERRWRAARKAGLKRVPVVVRDSNEAERLEAALIENMVREDLNPVEEARACAALVEDLGLTKEELGRRVGKSRPAVSNLIRLLELPDEALELMQSGQLSEGHGRAILQADGNDTRRRLARDAAAREWTVRETEKRARRAGVPTNRVTRTKPRVSAEEAAALTDAADRLEAALGHEVRLQTRGDELSAEIRFDDLGEVLALAKMLGRRRGK